MQGEEPSRKTSVRSPSHPRPRAVGRGEHSLPWNTVAREPIPPRRTRARGALPPQDEDKGEGSPYPPRGMVGARGNPTPSPETSVRGAPSHQRAGVSPQDEDAGRGEPFTPRRMRMTEPNPFPQDEDRGSTSPRRMGSPSHPQRMRAVGALPLSG